VPLGADQIAALIDRHGAELRYWILRRCPAPEDVVQEAFCRLAALKTPPDNPAAWLYAVTRNLADKVRRSDERRRKRERVVSTGEAYETDLATQVDSGGLGPAVARLSDDLREVVVARIWGDLTFEEIGRLCGISAATAWRRYEEALTELRKALTNPVGKPGHA
jgi:RNA polymerase sigma-70 factor (ECF subfamily)